MRHLGFRLQRAREPLWRNEGLDTLYVWPEFDSKATDPYRGGAFTFEFERSSDGSRLEKLAGRLLLDQLLQTEEADRFLALQNDIVASIARPPDTYLASLPERFRERYMAAFEPQRGVIPGDFWMRYTRPENVVAWLSLVQEMLPSVLERAMSLNPQEMYMGEPLSWTA